MLNEDKTELLLFHPKSADSVDLEQQHTTILPFRARTAPEGR